MRRIHGIVCLLAVTLAGLAGCGTRAVRQPVPRGDRAAHDKPSGTGWVPPGPALPPDAGPAAAPYLVWLATMGRFGHQTTDGLWQQPLVVYRVASLSRPAARIAVIAPPSCCDFAFVAAAGDDRTFLAAAAQGFSTVFYELRLGQDGMPQPLILLSFWLPSPILPDDVALTPDGRELAAVTARGRDGPYRISVIATSTGRARTWTWRGTVPMFPAWSGDHRLDFIASPHSGGSRLVQLNTPAPARHAAFRVLVSRFGQSGSLARWSPWWAQGLVITADGRTMFTPLLHTGNWTSSGGGAPRMALVALSATTGAPLRVLARPWAVPAGNAEYACGVFWTDATGRHYLFSCGLTGVRVDDGRFTPRYVQPAPYVPFPGSVFAW